MIFRLLLKKQLAEVFKSWFYNAKTNRARSKIGAAAMIALFALLMIGVLGGTFTAIAVPVCSGLSKAGIQWMYFSLFGLMAVGLGLFGSVFNTYSGLYLAKDNDLLLSLPIPTGTIIASRLVNVYLLGSMYSTVVFLPAIVVFQVINGFDAGVLLGSLVMLLEVSLLVLVLSCLLGFAVAKISLRLKRKSFVSVVASIAFIILYYFVYFKAHTIISELIANAEMYGEKIKGYAYILYLWGRGGTGDPAAILPCLASCALLAIVTWVIMSKSFINIATSSAKGRKPVQSNNAVKAKKLSHALLGKELGRLASSANYMLNCGFGVLFLPAAGIAVLVKGSYIVSELTRSMGAYASVLPIAITAAVCLMASMNDSAAPSVSLEGKALWIYQSLPIEPWQIIKAKILIQLLMTAVPLAFFCICMAVTLPLPTTQILMCIAMSIAFAVLSALFSMFIGLKMPMLNWTNEIVPIKQSGCVAIALFGGWGYAALMVCGYIGLSVLLKSISASAYLGGFAAITTLLSALLYRWLKTRGAELFSTL